MRTLERVGAGASQTIARAKSCVACQPVDATQKHQSQKRNPVNASRNAPLQQTTTRLFE